MPQGLQVWDENGVLVLDTSTLVMKQVDSVVVTGTTTVPITTPDVQTTVVPIITPDPSDPTTKSLPTAYLDGTNIRVNYGSSSGGRINTKVAYF